MHDHHFGTKIYHEYHRFRVYGFSRNFESNCPVVWGELPIELDFPTLCRFATVIGISCVSDGNFLGRKNIVEIVEDHLWENPKSDLSQSARGFKADARLNPKFQPIFERVVNREKHLHRVAVKYPQLINPTEAEGFTLHESAGGVSVGGIATQRKAK